MNKSKYVKSVVYSYLSHQEIVGKISVLSKSERSFLTNKLYFEGSGTFVLGISILQKKGYDFALKLAKSLIINIKLSFDFILKESPLYYKKIFTKLWKCITENNLKITHFHMNNSVIHMLFAPAIIKTGIQYKV